MWAMAHHSGASSEEWKCDVFRELRPYRFCTGIKKGRVLMKKDEHLSAETPLGRDKVVVYLDNLQFWAYRSAFDYVDSACCRGD
jgi:hypothetical protein